MRIIRFLACAGYCGLLTAFLLAPDPAELVGLRRPLRFPWGDIGIHFTTFTGLALLVWVAGWPRRISRPVAALLVIYALSVESLQYFAPTRSVELLDYTENLLGLAAGTGLYWLGQRILQPWWPLRTPLAELDAG